MKHELNSSENGAPILPSIQALTAFERAATLGSFAAAAAELNRTPSAISHSIKDLEAKLGLALFQRIGRSLELTDAGMDYLVTAQQVIFTLYEGARRMQHSREQSIVRVSALPFFTSAILMPNYATFESENPELELRIETTSAYADLQNNEVDLAIRFGTSHSQGLKLIPLLEISALPICSPSLLKGAPFTYEQLQQQTLIHVAQNPSAWSDVFASMGYQEFAAHHHLTFDSNLGALDAVKRGLGVGLAMSPIIQHYPGFGTEFVSAAPICKQKTQSYYIVCRKSSVGENKVIKTIDWLQRSVESLINTNVEC